MVIVPLKVLALFFNKIDGAHFNPFVCNRVSLNVGFSLGTGVGSLYSDGLPEKVNKEPRRCRKPGLEEMHGCKSSRVRVWSSLRHF